MRSRSRSPGRERRRMDDTVLSPAMRELQRQTLDAARRTMIEREREKRPVSVLSFEDATATKKQREIYVGNLAPGVDVVLGAFFDEALSRLFPDHAVHGPPVIKVNVDQTRQFGFVEFRSDFLANAAVGLHGTEIGGRAINTGRPKGFVEPENGHTHDQTPVGITRPYVSANLEVGHGKIGRPDRLI